MTQRDLWYSFCKYAIRWMPDNMFHNTVGWIMHRRFGVKFHRFNFKNPATFSEKIQFLKTHPVVPDEEKLADKYDVREFVKEHIGAEYLVPLVGKGVYSSVEEIDWNALPRQFVMKLTKGSGYNLICKDKDALDLKATSKKLAKWLKVNPYYLSREKQYCGRSRLICEQMLEYNITDYKFFCFDGVPTYVELFIDRQGNHKKLFCDMDWNKMPFTTANDHAEVHVEKPAEFEQMRLLAAKLSQGMKFVRVDLYIHDGKVFFGELTFHPAGGYTPITPREWDYRLGEKIDICDSVKEETK